LGPAIRVRDVARQKAILAREHIENLPKPDKRVFMVSFHGTQNPWRRPCLAQTAFNLKLNLPSGQFTKMYLKNVSFKNVVSYMQIRVSIVWQPSGSWRQTRVWVGVLA